MRSSEVPGASLEGVLRDASVVESVSPPDVDDCRSDILLSIRQCMARAQLPLAAQVRIEAGFSTLGEPRGRFSR